MSKTTNIISWITRLVTAVILLQTLFFKFTGAPESVYIFTKIGVEPWGRIGLGVVELIAAILILLPRTAGMGAIISIGLMAGAIFFHLTKLGIEVQGDGGTLFSLAVIVMATSVIAAWIHRKEIPFVGGMIG